MLPTGGKFAAGTGNITVTGAGTVTVSQQTQRGIVDWSSFSIGAGGRVLFNNGAGATLNRVIGGDLSRLDGLLKATGSLYLINSNGIIVGPNSCVLTNGSFVASTRDIGNAAFLAGGTLAASGTSKGAVINNGSVIARQGDVILIGDSVLNTGTISSPRGTTTLAAGNNVLLTTASGPAGVYVAASGTADSGSVTQTGKIEAAAAALKAAGGDIYTLAGNRSGLISATGTKTINGEVWLTAPNGTVTAGGSVAARNANGTGGLVSVNGRQVIVTDQARLSAQGTQGGTVAVGVSRPGASDLAGSTTVANGAVLAAGGPGGGGTIETSGHRVAIGKATIQAGKGGTWSLDPTDLNIDASAAATITGSLNGGTDVTQQTQGSDPGTDAGDINVNAPLNWTGTGSLTLSAYHDLNLNAIISGGGAFTGQAGHAVTANANASANSINLSAVTGNVTLGAGTTIAGAHGLSLQTGAHFINNAGANALSGGTGHWLVYSTNPASDISGGLTPDFLQYNAAGGATPMGSGNGLLYTATPSLSVALSGTVARNYDGTTSAPLNNSNAAVSGLINSDSAVVTGAYNTKNVGTGLTVTASNIAVTHSGIPVYGYAGTTPSVSANIGQIDKAPVTASIVNNPTKTYNGTTTATLTSSNYLLSGFASGEGATVNQPSSVAYDSADAGSRTVSANFSSTNFVPSGGTSFSNYNLPGSATGTGTINQAPLLIRGVLGTNKVYDRTTNDSLNTAGASLYGIIGSDNVSLNSASAIGTFDAGANVGNNLAVTASGFVLTGSKAANYALAQPSGLTGSITPAPLTISGLSAQSKTYDGTTAAALNTGGLALNGAIAGDSLSLGTTSASGNFNTADVGTGLAVNTSGFSFSGTGSSNYRLTQPSGLTADITPKSLAVAITGTPTKTYNGDAGAVLGTSDFSLSGFIGSESASIGQTSHAAYNTANAGTQTVTANLAVSDYTAGANTRLSNYALPAIATGTGTINPAPVTVSITGNPSKTYDGNAAATLSSANYLLSGFLSGQSATVNQTSGTYDSANAGVRGVTSTIGLPDLTPGSGTLLSNYSFPTTVTGSGTITPAPISGGIYAAITGNPTKSYDGNTVASLLPSDFSLTGFASGDGATVTQTIGTYANKNVGVQAVSSNLAQSDFSANGSTNLSNYTLPTVAYGSGTINPALLSASIVGTPTKVYNGTTRADLGAASFAISGLAPGEGVNLSDAIQASYDAKNAGSRTVTANIATTDITAQAGTLLANYTLPTTATGAGLITKAPVTVVDVTAQSKTYDTTTDAILNTGGVHPFGIVGSDATSLVSSGASASFAQANVGSALPVTVSGFALTGADAANYQLFQPTGLTANISKAPLSLLGVSANNKNYDNTNVATLNTGSATLAGVFSSDNGNVGFSGSGATASFASVNVGNSLGVSAGGFVLNGTQAANYSISQPSGLTANINPQPLTANIIGNPTKVYDGSASTTLTAANYQLVGFVPGQGASLPQSATASYVSPDAGPRGITSTLVSSDFLPNAGTNLSNYVLPTTGSGTGTITQAPLSAVLINNPTKQYDGTTTATLNSANYKLTGFIGSQDASVTQTSSSYDAAGAGSRSVTASLGAGDFSASNGSTNLANYALPTSATGTGTVTKAPLQVVNVYGTNRAYNGALNDPLNVASANVSGLFGSDSVTLNKGSAAGTFASKDVGTGIAVSASGFSISNGQSANYTLAQPTGLFADITQAPLIVTKVARVYDSTTGLPNSSAAYTLNGIFNSDSVSVDTANLTGSYGDKNVGTGKNVSLSGLALLGSKAGDYSIVSSQTGNIGTITTAPLTVAGMTANNKVYDATNAGTLNNGSATLSGLFGGDDVTLNSGSSSATFNNKNVGNGKTVTATGYSVSGADKTNYSFSQPTSLSANITPFTGISLASVTKTYNGNTWLPSYSSAYQLNGVLLGDNVSVATGTNLPTGSYTSKNAATGIAMNLSGITLAGTDSGNYSIPSTVTGQNIGIINPANLGVSIGGTTTKQYDSTTSAIINPSNYLLTGVVSGDTVGVTKNSGTYANANVGSPQVSTTLAGSDFSFSGTLASNYNLPTSASGNGAITPAPLTVTGAVAANKIYDGTTTAIINNSSAGLAGVFGSDTSSVLLNSGAALGTFTTKNAGSGIAVNTSGYALTGSKASNYTLAQPALAASISEALLQLTNVTKQYDATTAGTGTGVTYTLSGIKSGDSVSLTTSGLTGSYAAKNVGTGLSVSFAGLSLAGAQAANYSIDPTVTNALIGTITKAPLSVTGITGSNKVYDGTTIAGINSGSASWTGLLGSDSVILSPPSTGSYSSANVGTWTVTPSQSFTISGTDAGNYNFSQPGPISAFITPAPLTASIVGNPSKTYNASVAAALSSVNYNLSGFVGSQGATVNQTAGTYDAADAGSRTVSASLSSGNFAPIGGTLLSNYNLPTTATGPGTINQKSLSAVIVGTPTKTYDATTAATLNSSNYTLNGFVGMQGAAVTQTAGSYATGDAGTRGVTANFGSSDFTPNSGTTLANYLLPTSASGTGTINRKTVTASLVGNPTKIYDNTLAGTLTQSNYSLAGFIGSDGAAVSQTTATYDGADAGSHTISTTLTNPNFSGTGSTNLANYNLPTSASGTGTINSKTLTASIIGNPTKTYDDLYSATLLSSNYSLTGFIGTQGAVVNHSAGVYDTTNAGARSVTASLDASDFTATNSANLANYVLPTTASGAGTINPKSLTAAITGTPTKTYDGTSAATLGAGDYTLNGFVGTQGAMVTQTAGAYSSTNAGSRSVSTTLAGSDFSANSGTDLANYNLPTSATGTGTINPKAITATVIGNPTKVYDDTNAAALSSSNYLLSGFIGSQGASVDQSVGSYDASDAGARTVNAALAPGNLTLTGGASSSNYILPTSATGAGTITPKTLTASIVGDPAKTYDGTLAASLNPSNYLLDGFVGSQNASVIKTEGAYDGANAGSRTVTASLQAGDFASGMGTNLANYALPGSAVGTGTINPKNLNAFIIGNPTKTYDSTTTAVLTPGDFTLSGFVGTEGAAINQGTGSYNSADAGSRSVTTALLSSQFAPNGVTSLTNYILPTSASGPGTINGKTLTAAIIGNPTKTYDGLTGASLTPGNFALTGFVGDQGASVTKSDGLFDTKNAGTRTVGTVLTGNDFLPNSDTNLANYSLPSVVSGPGSITQRALSAAITGNPQKTYDSTSAAILVPGDYSLTGFVGNEGAAVTQTAGIYDGSDAGSHTVTAALSGRDLAGNAGTNLSNYSLPTNASGAGMVNRKQLSAAITGNPSKTYDSTNSAALSSSDYTLSGFANGQDGSVTQKSGTYDAPDAGTRTVLASLAPSDISASAGTNLANYLLPISASGNGTINRKAISIAITGQPTKIYDSSQAALLTPANFSLDGFLPGQNAIVKQSAGFYDSANAGNRQVTSSLQVGNYAASVGTNLNNYLLPMVATGAGFITPRQLSAVIIGNPTKMADQTTTAVLSVGNFSVTGWAPGEGGTVTQTAGFYDAPDAGARITTALLAPANFTPVNNTALTNYLLPTSAFGDGTITPAVLTNAPSVAAAIVTNMTIRNLAPSPDIAATAAQAVFGAAVPRVYIPYPAPSALSTWQNNGFGSLPTILIPTAITSSDATAVAGADHAVQSGQAVINSTEQILLQGGKEKSWRIVPPTEKAQQPTTEVK